MREKEAGHAGGCASLACRPTPPSGRRSGQRSASPPAKPSPHSHTAAAAVTGDRMVAGRLHRVASSGRQKVIGKPYAGKPHVRIET